MSEHVHAPLKPPPAPAVSLKRAPVGILQRKCGCGGSRSSAGECEDCKKKKMSLQRFSTGYAGTFAAPAIVHDVLRSPGQPLDAATRTFFEPRFGHDFSKVRVHTDAKAAESARAVNALAYTVGRNVVFGAGQYSPSATQTRSLLAHELTHVLQQGEAELPSGAPELTVTAPDGPGETEASHMASRSFQGGAANAPQAKESSGAALTVGAAATTPVQLARTWNDCGDSKDCPPRQPGELARAATAPLEVGTITSPEVGEIVSHFNVGSSSPRGLAGNPTWKAFVATIIAEDSRWEILGFADCAGGSGINTRLRRERAEAVLNALPPAARAKIDRAVGAPSSDCVAQNYVEWDRALNRSVVFRRTAQTIHFPPENISATKPACACGPDLTSQVAAAIASIGSTFAAWSSDKKDDACDALDSYRPIGVTHPLTPVGAIAWDIVELHNHGWVHNIYPPTCASEPAPLSCGNPYNFSIQIGPNCFYSGSVNYVIFGKMCKLCADYYLGIPLINEGYARFTRSAMRSLIAQYKGPGIISPASPNYGPSLAWAEAGYDDWPSGGTPPSGDCPCSPLCPTPYTGPSFHVNWYPNQYYTGGGGR